MKKNFNKIAIVIIATISILLITIYDSFSSNKKYETNDFLMDTVVSQTLYGKSSDKTAENVVKILTDFENEYSMYVENSSISLINKNSGIKSIKVSNELFELISYADTLNKVSDGSFDISIAPITLLWNIDGDNPHVPDENDIQQTLKLTKANIELDEAEKSVYLPIAGQKIDLGAIAKGYACDIAKDIYKQSKIKSALLSIGGNLLVYGESTAEDKLYTIGIRDPRGTENDYFATIKVDQCIIATSGDYERYFIEDGVRYCHILDPNTGYPADNGLISVTVICQNGMKADALSTTIFVDGIKNINYYLHQNDYQIIAVDDNYNVYCSPSILDNLTIVNDNYILIEE